jgi:hypothetical protein
MAVLLYLLILLAISFVMTVAILWADETPSRMDDSIPPVVIGHIDLLG